MIVAAEVLAALVAADSAVFTSAWADAHPSCPEPGVSPQLLCSAGCWRRRHGEQPFLVLIPIAMRKEQPEVQFVTFVLNDTQKTWQQILHDEGVPYRHAKLVLFRNATFSGLRKGAIGQRAVLLPGGRKSLYRSCFL